MNIRGEKKANTRGQVTIFIIIALVIVGMAFLIYFLTSSARTSTTQVFDANNPQGFLQFCLEEELESVVETISLQGGSFEPEFFFTYNNIPIEYLCYSEQDLELCVVQRPLLKQHIESEIKAQIEDDVEVCFNNLVQNYESRNYDVQLTSGDERIELLPKRVILSTNHVLTVTRGESQRYESFNVVLNNNLYELISISKSVIEWETTTGNADPGIYMRYYPDLKVEKNLREDGTRMYTLENRDDGNKFQFAVRSLVTPPIY